MQLNEKGQCPECKRKPLVYKREKTKFCSCCARHFHIDTGEQIENWAWIETEPGIFKPRESVYGPAAS
jgi:hypothetical protein